MNSLERSVRATVKRLRAMEMQQVVDLLLFENLCEKSAQLVASTPPTG